MRKWQKRQHGGQFTILLAKNDFIWPKSTGFRRKYWGNSVKESSYPDHGRSATRSTRSIVRQGNLEDAKAAGRGFKGLSRVSISIMPSRFTWGTAGRPYPVFCLRAIVSTLPILKACLMHVPIMSGHTPQVPAPLPQLKLSKDFQG
jgi:hypothetical protein